MNKNLVKKYFKENAKSWLLDGYETYGYNYPVGYSRMRIVLKILNEFNKRLHVMDLGCGGGQLSIALVKRGHRVVGIDQSNEMIAYAKSRLSLEKESVKRNIEFICQSFVKTSVDEEKFDAVISMGVIGYLPNDNMLFKIAHKLLKPKGLFLVSCRNKLFNMVSLSDRTIKEIKNKNAGNLVSEIKELYHPIPFKDAKTLIKQLKKNISQSSIKITELKKKRETQNESKSYTMNIEPRQHTPQSLITTAKKFGFKHESYYGVHPHLLVPHLNYLFPPGTYNSLSSSLEVLEHLPISLIWSSVFIGVFKKI